MDGFARASAESSLVSKQLGLYYSCLRLIHQFLHAVDKRQFTSGGDGQTYVEISKIVMRPVNVWLDDA